MYENLTYAELKNLPEEKKIEAWKELNSLYSSRELGQKLGTAPIAVINSIKKYVLGEPIGRANKKVRPEPQPQEEAGQKQEAGQPEVKTRRKYNRKAKADNVISLSKPDREASLEPEPVKEGKPAGPADQNSFSIAVAKTLSGEDAQVLLNGIGSTLLKNQRYLIEVKIVEK